MFCEDDIKIILEEKRHKNVWEQKRHNNSFPHKNEKTCESSFLSERTFLNIKKIPCESSRKVYKVFCTENIFMSFCFTKIFMSFFAQICLFRKHFLDRFRSKSFIWDIYWDFLKTFQDFNTKKCELFYQSRPHN